MRRSVLTFSVIWLAAGAFSASASPAPAAPAGTRDREVVATVGGAPVTRAELEQRVGHRLLPLQTEEFEARESFLRELIAERLFAREAARRKLSVDKLLTAEIDAKTPPVTEAETKAQYEAVKARVKDRPMEDVLRDIENNMRRQRQMVRREEYVRELFAAAGVKLNLEPPRVSLPVGAGEPAQGPANAPVTIIEYSDYQCPYCGRAAATIKQVRQKYGNQVRLVHRDFPLSGIHPFAAKAAEAAACAGDQGKFWEMNDRLFAQQDKLAVEDLKKKAADLGLEPGAFNACLDSGRKAAGIQKDQASAENLGLSGTPAFIINGRFVPGAQSLERYSEVVDRELARGRAGDTKAAPAAARPATAAH